MSDSPYAVWWIFLLGVLVATILLVAVVSTLVLSHRRYMALHRSHARKVLEAQEEERAWVSREVHDDAVQRLALIGKACGDAGRAVAGVSEEQAKRLAALQVEVQDLSVFLRGLARRLHPALIDRGGLRAALAGLGEEMERGFGLRVRMELPAQEALTGVSPQSALVIYRIAQEALSNVVKHAGVQEAAVTLSPVEGELQLIVTDRGRGFDGEVARGNGIGFIGMRERAYLAEGRVEVASEAGKGTVVRAAIPVGRSDGRTVGRLTGGRADGRGREERKAP